MYEGRTIRLRRLEAEDADAIFKKWNEYELRQYLPSPFPNTREDIQNFITSRNEAFTNRTIFTYGIEDKTSGNFVGFIDLTNITWVSSNGEIGMFAILDPEERGKGYGKDAMLVFLDFTFNVLGLHSIYLHVVEFNEHAIKFYEQIGFQNQGRLREAAYRNGKRYDIVLMDILKREFIERYGILPK